MNPLEQIFYPTAGVGCAIGMILAWKASGCRPMGQFALFISGTLITWLSIIVGVHWGYGVWQSMPNPPDKAFADGAKLTGSVLFGWMPSALGCTLAWLVGRLWRGIRGRHRKVASAEPN